MGQPATKLKPTEADVGFAWVCLTHCGRLSWDLLIGPPGWTEACQNCAGQIALENIVVNEDGRASEIIVP